MANSRIWVEVYNKDDHYQVRASAKGAKLFRERLNIDSSKAALARMDEYSELRNDDYFTSRDGAICFSCTRGRLAILAEMLREEGLGIRVGEELLPNEEETKEILEREGAFGDELAHLLDQNLPFYKRGAKSLIMGTAIRLGVLVVIVIAARVISLQSTEHSTARSFPAVMHTLDEEYNPQSYLSYFLSPQYTHRSLLKVKKPLYIRGNKMVLEGGYFLEIEGVQNLKASIEKRGGAPLEIRVDTREGEMTMTSLYVGDEAVAHKGRLNYITRIPLSPMPLRIDPTSQREGYRKVNDADPRNEESYDWMLGKKISMICRIENDGDRFLASGADGDFKFALPKNEIKQVITDILEMAVLSNERVILDIRLDGKAFPLRNRRNPRDQRRDLNLITRGSLHFAQVQGAVMKNL
jgi:hypothetical protein